MKNLSKTQIGLSLSGICLAVALLWWAEISYRLWLFFTDYKMELYANHTGDGYFSFVHLVLVCFLIAGSISTMLLSQEIKYYSIGALIPTALGIAAWIAVLVMHKTGVLIGYIELIARTKGIQP